jgi:hypothetical protein
MVSSTCFEQLAAHRQGKFYMQFYGILTCRYLSSLVLGRMYQIHLDIDQTPGDSKYEHRLFSKKTQFMREKIQIIINLLFSLRFHDENTTV